MCKCLDFLFVCTISVQLQNMPLDEKKKKKEKRLLVYYTEELF